MVFAINVTAPYLASRKAIPVLLEQGKGVIINTASIAGVAGGRSGASYAAAK
jgi:NAD(P)-dependent dehydrogenase (short-subunit alcohol dehydrogenase family)